MHSNCMKLALGTAQFGLDYGVANTEGRVELEIACAVLARARELGIDTLDTAMAYGDSESVIGCQEVQDWKVVTKLPMVPDGCSNVQQWVRDRICESLLRLGVQHVYGLLLHCPRQLLGKTGVDLYTALQALKEDGLVKKIGVSVYGPEELSALWPKFQFDLIQSPLNILDRSLVESGWVAKLKREGVEVHVRSVFLQGLLLMSFDKRPRKFNIWSEEWREWDLWLSEMGLSPLEACVRYVTGVDSVDRIVVGVDSVSHLNQIVDSVGGGLQSLPFLRPLKDRRLINPALWNQI